MYIILYAVLCNGLVVAKESQSCDGGDIRQAWNASCGNVAFMPCNAAAPLTVGSDFEICLAGFPNRKLVYDMHLR